MVRRGGAFIGPRRAADPGERVKAGARVRAHLDEREKAHLDATRILLQDDDALFVDKPAGVASQQPLEGGDALPELVARLVGGPALLVHRLDIGTTGVTVLARHPAAQRRFLEAFREHVAEKRYLALVAGAPRKDVFSVEAALAADPAAPRRKVDEHGDPASTDVEVVERFGALAALVRCTPRSGRTHQIRAHLAHVGLPLVGDARYGGPRALTKPGGRRVDAARPLLHAEYLALPKLGDGRYEVGAPVPPDLAAALLALK